MDKERIANQYDGLNSSVEASLDGHILTIEYARYGTEKKQVVRLDIAEESTEKRQLTEIVVRSLKLKNTILLVEPVEGLGTLVVFVDDGIVKHYIHTNPNTHPLGRLIYVKSKTLPMLTRRNLRLFYICYIENPFQLDIRQSKVFIGDQDVIDFVETKKIPEFIKRPSFSQLLKAKPFFKSRASVSSLLQGEPLINSRIGVMIELDDGQPATHFLTKGSKRIARRGTKWYYAPIARTRKNGYSVSIRRNAHGGLNLVRRPLEVVEKTIGFRFYESLIVSFLLYNLAHLVRFISPRKANIYFEKNASQSEEGVLQLCQLARDKSVNSHNYFIIRGDSAEYESIRYESGVIKNFTLKSYWLMYRANCVIASEVPQHVNILRSDNYFARLAPYSQGFIFLQHGITYLKPQDKTTSFKAGREGEPDLMIVSSAKEKKVVSEMLNIEEERLLKTGMTIFDTIKYNHIKQDSEDIVTVMLTWKPYEEHLQDFEKSNYYQEVVKVYEMVKKISPEAEVRVVIHPKFVDKMAKTSLAESIWQGKVSDALNGTKLLITDYSSVCYNVFYQGGGVVFYQPDLEEYERNLGKLIPGDDEYIGYRIFKFNTLEEKLKEGMKNKKIDLVYFRTPKYIANYRMINEFNDGKNSKRIIDRLIKLKII